jgi:hypothetical protein
VSAIIIDAMPTPTIRNGLQPPTMAASAAGIAKTAPPIT